MKTEISNTIEGLDLLRAEIDQLDHLLIELLDKRFRTAEKIGRLKIEKNVPVVQNQRFQLILDRLTETGRTLNISEKFMTTYLNAVHQESIRRQLELLKGN